MVVDHVGSRRKPATRRHHEGVREAPSNKKGHGGLLTIERVAEAHSSSALPYKVEIVSV